MMLLAFRISIPGSSLDFALSGDTLNAVASLPTN